MRISDWSSDVCSSDLLVDPLLAAADRASQHPALAVHQLGGGISDYVRAQLHRTLERGGGKGIVNHGGDPVRAGKIADEFDIDHIERGIGRRLEEEHRSEERRVGQECDSTWRSRRSTNHK